MPGRNAIAEALHRRGQRVAHVIRVGLHVAREQGLADDRERERRHLLSHVDGRVGRDRLTPAKRVPDHRVGEALHLLAMEERLDGAALLEVRLAFGSEEAFAQQPLGALQRDAFVELLRGGDQHVFDPCRMADEVDLLPADAEAGDVAVLALRLGEELERIAPKAQEARAGKPGGGSRHRLHVGIECNRHAHAHSASATRPRAIRVTLTAVRKLDVFNHIYPRPYFDRMLAVAPGFKDVGKRSRGVPMLYDLDERFRVMDRLQE